MLSEHEAFWYHNAFAKKNTTTSTAASYWEFGLKKADQQIILDDFNKYGPGWVYSKQRCVNEGAALGRGAATSGFNKFIELTEAAKDLKDGSLSQLISDCSRSLKAPSLEFPEYIKQRGYDLHDVQAYLKVFFLCQ
ncbi:BnaCnng06400D [Brassica napus]|uniref:Uncharacterized protein n=2 Tax=Brassica TaxID=3705 RepID=A0A3P6GHM8_BRAOL|nr:unnamed protein product [Brassica napus]CDY32131.1 BnaCnng06400D [Brassica napus]VDD55632.1 unnamed protein product [Brassica oleracea]